MTEKKLPSKLTCVKCGDKKGVRKDVLEKRITKFGSLDAVQKKYHCIKCRKAAGVRADGRMKPKVNHRDPNKPTGEYWNTQEFRDWLSNRSHKDTGPKPMSLDQIKDSTTPGKGDQCLRPDIWSSNGRACDGCPYFEHEGERFCQQPDAGLKGDKKKKDAKKAKQRAYMKKYNAKKKKK